MKTYLQACVYTHASTHVCTRELYMYKCTSRQHCQRLQLECSAVGMFICRESLHPEGRLRHYRYHQQHCNIKSLALVAV